MNTSPSTTQYQTKSGDRPLAILFFFLGAPHLYSFFKHDSLQRMGQRFWSSLLGYSLVIGGLTGTIMLSALTS